MSPTTPTDSLSENRNVQNLRSRTGTYPIKKAGGRKNTSFGLFALLAISLGLLFGTHAIADIRDLAGVTRAQGYTTPGALEPITTSAVAPGDVGTTALLVAPSGLSLSIW